MIKGIKKKKKIKLTEARFIYISAFEEIQMFLIIDLLCC